jgi:hypothetical protein
MTLRLGMPDFNMILLSHHRICVLFLDLHSNFTSFQARPWFRAPWQARSSGRYCGANSHRLDQMLATLRKIPRHSTSSLLVFPVARAGEYCSARASGTVEKLRPESATLCDILQVQLSSMWHGTLHVRGKVRLLRKAHRRSNPHTHKALQSEVA